MFDGVKICYALLGVQTARAASWVAGANTDQRYHQGPHSAATVSSLGSSMPAAVGMACRFHGWRSHFSLDDRMPQAIVSPQI